MTSKRDHMKKFTASARASTGIDATPIKFLAEPVVNLQNPEYEKAAGTYWIGKDLDAKNITGGKFVADVADTMTGLRKFTEGKVKVPVYAVITIGGDVLLPERALLGDTDTSKWQLSKYREGERQDPWRVIWILPLYDSATGDTLVFSPESGGGINAIADLVDAYAERPDGDEKLPLISLQSHSRAGSNGKRYSFPILRIESWVDRPAEARRLQPPPLPIAPRPTPQGELALNGNGAAVPAAMPHIGGGDDEAARLIDDDIPF